MQQVDQLVDEIKQICVQYKAEVPEARRAWPTSIRERVSALRRLDLSSREIAERTGIPKATVYIMWAGRKYSKKRKNGQGQFVPVSLNSRFEHSKVQINKSNSETNPTVRITPTPQETFSATLPGGIRIEGLTLNAIIELSRRMSS